MGPISKETRANLGLILWGASFAAFALNVYLTLHFTDTLPREAVPTQGAIYGMNDHGIVSYLTSCQVNELSVLLATSIALSITGVALLAPLTPKKQPWEKYRPAHPGTFLYFGGSFVLSAFALWLTIEHIASHLAHRGFTWTFGLW